MNSSSPPDSAAPTATSASAHAHYWRNTRHLTLRLLTLWFVVTFVAVFFARELDRINLFGWPLSFYMAAQGVMLVYLAIVVIYMLRMRRAEQQLEQQLERQLQAANESTHGE